MKTLAVVCLSMLAIACVAKPKPDPLHEEIMSWQPRSTRPSITYTYQPPPMPQTVNVYNPALGYMVPVTVYPLPAWQPTWSMSLNPDGSSDFAIQVAPGVTVVY